MKKKIVLIVLFSAVLLITAGFVLIQFNNEKQDLVCMRNKCFKVELAQTIEELKQGLMFRQDLEEDEGMLFIFEEEGEYGFWMKNTLIPLDVIWINKDKEVVFISENVPSCQEDDCPSINPNKKAQYVLELKGGASRNINLSIGDRIEIKISTTENR